MTRYALKNKDKQAQLDALSDVNKFSERLQISYEKQKDSNDGYVRVCFGRTLKIYTTIVDEFIVIIPKSEIEVIKDLKPYIWHMRDEWDGNPNGYPLVEHCEDEDIVEFFDLTSDDIAKTYLDAKTTHFMYIERPEVSNG